MKRAFLLAAVGLLAAACERPEPFAPHERSQLSGGLARPFYSAGFTSSWTHAVLPMLGNVQLASAAGVALNENGWIVGSTEASFDGQFFSTTHATLWTPAGVQDLGVLPPQFGQLRSWANAINDNGVVAGMGHGENSNGACCVFRAFIWTASAGMQALPLLAATATAEARAHGISNLGHVVGQATNAAGVTRAVIWTAPDQPPVELGTGAGSAVARDINDAGQVIGAYFDGMTAGAFLWSPGAAVQLLGDLGGFANPHRINNGGQVVGDSYTADGTLHPFLWTPAGGMQDLGLPPGAAHASARGINNAGHIAVSTVDEDPATGEVSSRAFLWVAGVWIELEPADVVLTGASDINDRLQVAGRGFVPAGHSAVRWDVTLTPTSPQYSFSGFFAPISNLPTVNRARAGQAIPVKFSLGGNHGIDIFAPGLPLSQPIACDAAAPTDAVEATGTAGQSSLSYDPATDQYVYIWKTDRRWANSCRRLTVRFNDGTEHSAHFEFTR
jgi:probable HAF family extracellular repeat protein